MDWEIFLFVPSQQAAEPDNGKYNGQISGVIGAVSEKGVGGWGGRAGWRW